MSIKNSISFLFLLVCFSGLAQTSFQREVNFLEHLESINAYHEATLYIDQIYPNYPLRGERDSLSFFQGKYAYEQKMIPASISHFRQVSSQSTDIWEISQFFVAFQLAYLHETDSSITLLEKLHFEDSVREELKMFELASDYLLKRDFEKFDASTEAFSYQYYHFSDYEKDMISLANDIRNRKRKSPFLAGLMSAIVPGAGKYYQGQIGQGTMALVGTGIFALQAWEGYRKDGPESARFIIFGSVFSVFYIANIWGSAVSVRINKARFNDSANEVIYVNMHLPIRLLFR